MKWQILIEHPGIMFANLDFQLSDKVKAFTYLQNLNNLFRDVRDSSDTVSSCPGLYRIN